jgi:flagellar M-ring protein FliF
MDDNAIATTENSGSRLDPFKQLTRSPATRQLLTLVGVAAAVALGVAVVLWSRGPNYGLLYSGLDQKDASAITQELQSTGTPFELSADGSSIMAPAADLAGLRLKLAANGLPQGTAGSSASATADSPFGMSDLAERKRYQQQLEADLGNTIGGLQSVRAARVHLALPKSSAFIRDSRPASASVLITLYRGRQLDPGQVAAIVHLVAASVPDLDASQVSVIDQQGQLLTTDANSPAAAGDTRLQLATRIENTYAARIEQLLIPLVGPGRVHAQVNVDLDFSQSEKATESFDPKSAAIRSEQTSNQQSSSAEAKGGVPGALSNQPPNTVVQPTAANPGAAPQGAAATAAATTTGPTESSSSATRNYEMDRTISHVSDPAGRLARLSVAVVVDDKPATDTGKSAKSVPFSEKELQRLTELTKNAVGFSASRGDTVSVVNQAFQRGPSIEALPEVPLWQRPGAMDLIKQGIGILVALLVAFGLLRPLLKGALRGEPTTKGRAKALTGSAHAINVRDDDDAAGGAKKPALLSGSAPQLAYEQRIDAARQMVGADSKQVAQIVKNWVNEDAA